MVKKPEDTILNNGPHGQKQNATAWVISSECVQKNNAFAFDIKKKKLSHVLEKDFPEIIPEVCMMSPKSDQSQMLWRLTLALRCYWNELR